MEPESTGRTKSRPIPSEPRERIGVARRVLQLVPTAIAVLFAAHGRPQIGLGPAAAAVLIGVADVVRQCRSDRDATRVASGRCASCGYDLRASIDARPECGRPIDADG